MTALNVDVEGTLEWAKIFEFNRDRAAWNEETDGEYKVSVITNEKTAKELKDIGVRKQITKEDEGYRVTFSRPHKGKQDWMGGPPIVADLSGKPWDVDSKGTIGNGSKGIVRIQVYDGKAGKGTRLMGVQIIDHVVYEGDGSNSNPTQMFQDRSTSQEAAPF
tara:strand:- start:247 stop:732 length:486 start_codon:yes stop_codon:yes gene_type:complete